ncbi:MAG: hypothetical protein J6U54_09260 [Clostridiales bacterium]|nr:hypothetical protein [Clostridiales bacterium]
MIRIAMDLPGQFYSEAIGDALGKTGNFRVSSLIEKNKLPEDTVREYRPDEVLLGISTLSGYTLVDRMFFIRKVRRMAPLCKIILFFDESVSEEITEGVKSLKQCRLIDGFLYSSLPMNYLVATLESA